MVDKIGVFLGKSIAFMLGVNAILWLLLGIKTFIKCLVE
jgi:hypothetical protein